EAGLGWITKFTKDFVNTENLKKQKEDGAAKKLAGFRMEERGIPRSGYDLLNENDEIIGRVTSGSMSPSLGVGIGMGYVQSKFASPDTELLIAIRKRKLKVKIVKPPFYKA
ncbi:MAG: glycine cleavage system aminomethyltransferase GcvT, partial [Cyclobacteriaceae bacterium]|nr:glycine cleavage system aminomethyltransferase GcvT [Cyclobacteriaceae bacterium]